LPDTTSSILLVITSNLNYREKIMNQTIEVKVPDIGDFKDVAVIEILVKAGDTVAAEQSLIALETDKAAMEVPSPAAGVVTALKVKIGDKINKGSVILTLESRAAVVAPAAKPAASVPAAAANTSPVSTPKPIPTPAPAAKAFTKGDIHAEVVVLGAGPGGYTAAFRAADLGKQAACA
jgi:dihydrolipoamide dehydrogenase